MKYYSTNHKAPIATLEKAVVKGLAEDRGLYMPEVIKRLPQEFFDNIENFFLRFCFRHKSVAPVLGSNANNAV